MCGRRYDGQGSLGRFGGSGNTRTVIAHEGTHQFEDFLVPFHNAPIWILEGFAVFFESAYYDPVKKKVKIATIPKDRLAALKRGIAGNTTIPLVQLIRTPQYQFSGYHYAHAWGLIYYILYFNKNDKARKKNTKLFTDMFMMATSKKVQPADVEELFGGPEKFKEFEIRWKEWIAELPYDYDPPMDKQYSTKYTSVRLRTALR